MARLSFSRIGETLAFGLMLAGVVSAHIAAAWAVEPHQPAERVAHVARASR